MELSLTPLSQLSSSSCTVLQDPKTGEALEGFKPAEFIRVSQHLSSSLALTSCLCIYNHACFVCVCVCERDREASCWCVLFDAVPQQLSVVLEEAQDGPIATQGGVATRAQGACGPGNSWEYWMGAVATQAKGACGPRNLGAACVK